MPNGGNTPFPILEGDNDAIPEVVGRNRWVEETYGDRAWVASGAPPTSGFFGLAATSRRLFLFFGILGIALITLLGRVGYLVAHGDTYRALSEGNRLRTITIPAARGVIYDRNGVQLVDNISDLEVAVVPADLPKDIESRSDALGRIAQVTGEDPATYSAALDEFGLRSYQPVVLGESVTRDQAVQLTILGSDLPAIRIISGAHREYTESNTLQSLSHVLGYMGKIGRKDLDASGSSYTPSDRIGKAGLELSYEDELRGTPGTQKVEVDALGSEVRTVSSEEPKAGDNLELAIDNELTTAVEGALKRELGATRLKRGAVVVEDATNGEILSLVSLPAYSNNRFAQGIAQSEYSALADDPNHPLFPRAIAGSYPSGSTIKLVVAAAALTEGVITPTTTVLSTGGLLYANRYWFPDWKAGGHGYTDVRKAIAESVNTFFYMVGGGYEDFVGLGIDRLVKYYGAFGIGHALGIDLPAENDGFLPTPAWKLGEYKQEWFIGDTYHVSIGQGDLLVTPLQVAGWTTAVANGGTVYKPRVVTALVAPDGTRTALPSSAADTPPVDASALAVVRQGMRQAVTVGSARALDGIGIHVAGKTGTAQWNSNKANHAWFTGFAPYEDPKIVVTVLIEEGGEGSSVAVPVARDIFMWWATHRQSSTAP